ncbi:DapH/DapD/GlmU-related protein [Pseudomonas kulmbachensis]|uniref:DapH/DapD/GlmU-related protein n=1 Tax=Pseudomonas kulmbachensis TaxID=3043408 RepID=UPI002AB2D6DE|nr:DapH/DapD/GlmU-related protein [Pseudomonas sp. FLM 004-28]
MKSAYIQSPKDKNIRTSFTITIRNIFFFLWSKVFFGKKVRIIKGFPRLINKGRLTFGDKFTAGLDLRLEVLKSEAAVLIGDNVKINDYCHIGAITTISIFDNCLIGSRVTIVDHEHGVYVDAVGSNLSHPDTPPDSRELKGSPITIESNSWLGEGVVVLSGVTIGEGSIIGANAVVTHSIPKYSIAVGVPAKVIKKFNFTSNTWEKT